MNQEAIRMSANDMDWARHKTYEEIRADMVEGAKMRGMTADRAEAFVSMILRVTCLSCGAKRERHQQCCGH
ncbi:MAG TPA: hypothetical protein VJ846_11575 [Sphingomicrobium sp.]|nr:hypothetical protein [Sphingomicrobium sp.]